MRVSLYIPNKNLQSPAFKRISLLRQIFQDCGCEVVMRDEYRWPSNPITLVSFPPFPKLVDLLFLLCTPGILIVDYRDGWGLAIKTGYGGLTRSSNLKAFIVGIVEKLIYFRSSLIITVTPGLAKYHKSEKTILLPNGSEIPAPQRKKELDTTKRNIKAICFGKFHQYGIRNVEKILSALESRYKNNIVTLHVYSQEDFDWFNRTDHTNIKIVLHRPFTPNDLVKFLRGFDIGIAVIRDPEYDFGTKIYDYAQAGLPILNYFDGENDITRVFKGCFDNDVQSDQLVDYSRKAMMYKNDLHIFLSFIKYTRVKLEL